MSGNRKRTGTGGNILDQLEPGAARGKAPASFRIGIGPRWVRAAGGAIVLLVGALAAIAWSTTTTAKALPQAATVLLAQVEPPPMPPPMPLVVLPKQVAPQPAAKVVREAGATKPALAAPVRAGKPAGQRQAARRKVPKSQKAKTAPAPEAAQDADPDVALIRAIRKATQSR